MSTPHPIGSQEHRDARRDASARVAVVGAIVNLVLSLVKVVVGVVGHSQALIVDGIHSISDLLTDVLVFIAARHAAHGPDEAHPYGHGRFETAATLALGAFLVLIAGGIMWDSVERLNRPEGLLAPEPIALYAALFSILANEGLYWYTRAVARRIKSDLLMANAWHHRSDAISSIVVLVGVAGALLGHLWLDLVAALIVGFMVAKIGWDLGWSAMRELVDEALEEEKVEQIRRAIFSVPGVRSIHMLRTRRQGHEAMADVHVQVRPWISVSEGHMISIAVEESIKAAVEEITDITVHIDPENDEEQPTCKGLPLRETVEAELRRAWGPLGCLEQGERILLHYLAGRIDVDVLFPLSCYQDEAHARQMETAMREALAAHAHYGRVRLFFGNV